MRRFALPRKLISVRGPKCTERLVWSNSGPAYSLHAASAPTRRRNRSPSGWLVLAAGPEREPDSRRGELLRVAPERKPEDLDELLLGGGTNVIVRGERGAEVGAPAFPGPNFAEELPHIRDDRGGQVRGKYPLEVLAGERVLPLLEERARELEAHPQEVRALDLDQ